MKKFAGRSNRRSGVVLCGAYGYGNAGDEAILNAIVTELRTLDPQMPICVMTRRPRETEARLGVRARYTFNIPAFCYETLRAKLYLNGGGSLIQDVTSRRSLWFYLLTITLAKHLGCKVLMYGCGIGPVKHPDDRKLAARILNRRVDAITLRDPVSKEELERMGVTRPEIIVAADPTVVLPAAESSVVDELFRRWGMDPEGRYLGITVRPWAGFDEKAPIFAAAADHAYHRHGLTPVFIPIERRH
ncbi:MAG: polysaccharide pyruvyl transferase family protein, partial [Clostridia bacterium]|nr:polysaccharide pyruvyl transferase family protein [Clostridia bacterium]